MQDIASWYSLRNNNKRVMVLLYNYTLALYIIYIKYIEYIPVILARFVEIMIIKMHFSF